MVTEEGGRADGLQRQIDSIACMLGWGNTPPQDTLEKSIRAMKERLGLAEDERGEARRDLQEHRRVWRGHIDKLADMLCLPQLSEGNEYGGGAIRGQIGQWAKALEFYALLGNWQPFREGYEESASDRDMGGRARVALGRPDREVTDEDEEAPLDRKSRLLKQLEQETTAAQRTAKELLILMEEQIGDGVFDVWGTSTGRVQCKEPNVTAPRQREKTCETCGNCVLNDPHTEKATISPMMLGHHCGSNVFKDCAEDLSWEHWTPKERPPVDPPRPPKQRRFG